MHSTQQSLFTYVLDTCSLIFIKDAKGINYLKKRVTEILVPEEVEKELIKIKSKVKTQPLLNLLKNNPHIIAKLEFGQEQNIFYQILTQSGMRKGYGEAACIAIALSRNINYFVTDDIKARKKATNHGISCLYYHEF